MQTLPPTTNEGDEKLLIEIVTTYRVPRSPNYILSENGETKIGVTRDSVNKMLHTQQLHIA